MITLEDLTDSELTELSSIINAGITRIQMRRETMRQVSLYESFSQDLKKVKKKPEKVLQLIEDYKERGLDFEIFREVSE